MATAAVECYYRPYLERQAREVEELRRDEGLELPAALDYGAARTRGWRRRLGSSRVSVNGALETED